MATEKTTILATRLPVAAADAAYRHASERQTTVADLIRQGLEKIGVIPAQIKEPPPEEP